LEAAARSAQVIILATPLQAVIDLIPRVVASASSGTLILDVASVKAPVMAAARRALLTRPQVGFVGGHPMAGRELGGPQAALPHLFRSRTFVLCEMRLRSRGARTQSSAAMREARAFVRSLGALPLPMDPREHDRIVALTSALPQLCAVGLALAVEQDVPEGARRVAGSGFGSTARLAVSPLSVWLGPLMLNARNVGRALDVFQRQMRLLSHAVTRQDNRALGRHFARAARAKRRFTPG